MSGEGWNLASDAEELEVPYKEEVLYRPWVQLYLNQVRDISLRVMSGELIDPFLDWVVCKRDLSRLPGIKCTKKKKLKNIFTHLTLRIVFHDG